MRAEMNPTPLFVGLGFGVYRVGDRWEGRGELKGRFDGG